MSTVLLKTIKKRIDFIKAAKKGKKELILLKYQKKEKSFSHKVLFFKNIKGIFHLKKIQLELDLRLQKKLVMQ